MFDTFIVNPIFNALMFIYSLIPGGDFGVAIILFTILVRFALYPLVKAQLHQTKQMRKMQPELKKIKQLAKGNKQVEAMQQMELYKRYGISPFRSIIILLIQLPIFIGLYQVIQIVTLHRDKVGQYMYEPLKQIDAIKQVIEQPDQFNHLMLGFIDLTKTAVSGQSVNGILLVLAVISALTQYIMTKQTMPTNKTTKKFREVMAEAASGKQSDPTEVSAAMMNNMVKFMPIMMFFIMVSLPGALALYYTASNLVAVAQQHYLLSKDSEELDEIADEADGEVVAPKKSASSVKSAKTAKTRAKKASEAKITRIKAKG